jgi:dolichol-phosphate mannosyltransferase
MRCVIVVPTYNEAATLPGLLAALEAVRVTVDDTVIDVLVVDDSSPDGTGDLARAHRGFGTWLTLATRRTKDGLGSTYRADFVAALADGHDAVVRLRTRDSTAGFRARRSEALLAAGVVHTASNGYGFQMENARRCESLGLRVAEHPITFTERTAGASKMSSAVAREADLPTMVGPRWR